MNANDRKDLAEFKEDLAAIAEKARIDFENNMRYTWSQKNGNDSGYDPYWNLD
jgi:hypothetical protein